MQDPRKRQPTKGEVMENVIAVTFDDDSKAYTALTLLGELGQQHRVELGGASVVVRAEDGHVETKEEIVDSDYEGTAYGGVIGLLLGVIGGPLGVLIGGATGVLVGSLFDLDDEETTESALSAVSRSVRPDHPTLLAVVSEQNPEVIDAAMAEHGGTVMRRPLADVMAEIAAAEDAQRQAKREASKRLREERKAETKTNVQAKIDGLKAKLHKSPVGAGSG
jgi:uncharacterized membrane protein